MKCDLCRSIYSYCGTYIAPCVYKARNDECNETNSRFAVCDCGGGFTVEDRKTGQRVSYHTSYTKALKARAAAAQVFRAMALDTCSAQNPGGTA